MDKITTYFSSISYVTPYVHTDLLWKLSIFFIIVSVLYFILIFRFRTELSAKSKKVQQRKTELTPMIVEFLFYDKDTAKSTDSNNINLKIKIRELLIEPFNRKVLIDVLLYLRKDLSGTTLTKLLALYQDLGLHHDSYKKLKSWKWQTISKGIMELTQMGVTDSYIYITKFINDKRSTIRKQAEIAVITLKAEGLDYFLDTTTNQISEWQQLKIMEVLKNKKDYQPPTYSHWLISKNNDVVLFAIRLMKNYNQSDGKKALIELLKHKSEEINIAAIQCIKEFTITEAIDTLKLVFWHTSTNIKISILDTIATIGGFNEIEFLNTVNQRELNFNVKSKSLSSINSIAPRTVLPTKDIRSENSFVNDDTQMKQEENLLKSKTDNTSEYEGKNETFEIEAKDNDLAINTTMEEDLLNDTNTESQNINIDFLPVIYSELKVEPKGRLNLDNQQNANTDDIFNLETIYEDISQILQPVISSQERYCYNKHTKLDIPLNEIDVLWNAIEAPIYVPYEFYQESTSEKEVSSTKNSSKNYIKHIECIVEEIKVEQTISDGKYELIDEMEFLNALQNEVEEEQITLNWLLAENEAQTELKQKIKSILVQDNPTKIQKTNPVNNSEDEAKTLLILNEIETIGDAREIPLLEELLTYEDNEVMRSKIIALINKLTGDKIELEKEKSSSEIKVTNTFDKFYHNLDKTSKLILLDEIANVGDENEIPFLNNIIATADNEIKLKAQNCRTQLNKRLLEAESIGAYTKENELSKTVSESFKLAKKAPKQDLHVFDIDFSLNESPSKIKKDQINE